jgi:hydroxyacyl-ACP dehydratase HTD2-like protein with hotdog domain
LFRFSALTFNAHSIHLDKLYTTQKEGYRNLLVHGPLTLCLMLTVFRQCTVNMGLSVAGIDYRNLAPLLVGEELAVCLKPKGLGEERRWDIWIEGPGGGLAVRGTIQAQ